MGTSVCDEKNMKEQVKWATNHVAEWYKSPYFKFK